MNNTNEAFILWIDGKPSKISSDRQALFGEYNDAKYEGKSVDITWHEHYQDAYDIVHAQTTNPNPNRFIKSSFTLSLLWVAKFYSVVDKACTSTANQNIYAALYHFFSPLNLYLRITMPNTLDWLYS